MPTTRIFTTNTNTSLSLHHIYYWPNHLDPFGVQHIPTEFPPGCSLHLFAICMHTFRGTLQQNTSTEPRRKWDLTCHISYTSETQEMLRRKDTKLQIHRIHWLHFSLRQLQRRDDTLPLLHANGQSTWRHEGQPRAGRAQGELASFQAHPTHPIPHPLTERAP